MTGKEGILTMETNEELKISLDKAREIIDILRNKGHSLEDTLRILEISIMCIMDVTENEESNSILTNSKERLVLKINFKKELKK